MTTISGVSPITTITEGTEPKPVSPIFVLAGLLILGLIIVKIT